MGQLPLQHTTPPHPAHFSWPPTSAPWRGHADTWHVTRLVTTYSVIDSYRHKYASRIQKLSHSRWKLSGNVDTVDFYLNKCFNASMFSRTIHLNISTESLHLHRIFMFWWNSKWFSAFCFKLIELLKYDCTRWKHSLISWGGYCSQWRLFFISFYQKWRKHQCSCLMEMFGNVLHLNEWIHVWHLDLHHHIISPPICLFSYTHGEFLNSMTERQRHCDSCKYFELIEIW